jgi:hypothetical protein
MSQNLNTFKDSPEYSLYLAYIFNLTSEAFSVRTCAGLILKNNLINGSVPSHELPYVKYQVVSVLGDPDGTVRRTTGSLITTLLSECLPILF